MDAAALPPGPGLPATLLSPLFARDPVGVLRRCRAPAIALTWLLRRLAGDRSARQAFLSDDTQRREAVIDEVLRTRPPALASLRRLTATATAGEHELPAGTNVMVPPPLLHSDPAVFPDPDEFRPERFAGTDRPATFAPFGGGTRSCPAEPLARVELRTVVPELLGRLSFRFLHPAERPVQRATVLVPHRSGAAIAAPAA